MSQFNLNLVDIDNCLTLIDRLTSRVDYGEHDIFPYHPRVQCVLRSACQWGALVFKARPLSLRKLLAGQYHFRLPRFQRHYAWTDQVVTKLFDDLKNARAEEAPDGGPRTTFLGAIIVIQSATPGPRDRLLGRREFDIIDGQQRLITLTLMLCIVRDLLTGRQQTAIDRAIAGSAPADIPWRLTLRRVDEELFERVAKTRGATREDPDVDTTSDTARNMMTNRRLLRDGINRLNDNEEDDLYDFGLYLLDHCQIAMIEADHHDDANQIYEALNHSGLALQLSSHIKTLAFRGTPEGDPTIDALAEEWDDWERKLTILRFNRLFSILRAIHSPGSKPIALENEKIIQKVGGCKPYLEEIVRPAVTGYMRIVDAANGKGEDHPEVRKYLTYLNWLRDSDWVGPVIKWFQLGPNDDAATIDFLRRIDRLAFCLLINSVSVNERARRFKRVLDEISSNGVRDSGSALDLNKKEQARVLFRLSNDFQHKGGRACKLVLVRVSDVIGKTLTREIPADLTIEHVLPRHVNDNKTWTTHYESLAEMQRCFKRFANMVPLPKHINERIKNFDFVRKIDGIFYFNPEKKYQPTSYALTNLISECNDWDAATIDARDDELFVIIKELWSLQGKGGRELDKGNAG